jgi:hypothetical protein
MRNRGKSDEASRKTTPETAIVQSDFAERKERIAYNAAKVAHCKGAGLKKGYRPAGKWKGKLRLRARDGDLFSED